jgi:RimJ/RimL family protein N-acetyltransferase
MGRRYMIKLIPVCKNNIGLYEIFEKNYNTHLKNYLSRIYPHNYKQYEDLIKRHLLVWNYVYVDQSCIGSVWLEKETPNDSSATLGIFIDDESNRGKGIGAHVIMQSIKTGVALMNIRKVELSVRAANVRAYHCYKKCGFQETTRFIKSGNFEVVQMELLIN